MRTGDCHFELGCIYLFVVNFYSIPASWGADNSLLVGLVRPVLFFVGLCCCGALNLMAGLFTYSGFGTKSTKTDCTLLKSIHSSVGGWKGRG